MDSSALYSRFRSEVYDVAAPYLWSDAEVFAYADAAQKRFCQLAYGIADARTDEVVRVTVVAGEEYADVHPSILTFRSARLVSNGRELKLLNPADTVTTSDDYGRRSLISDRRPGSLIALVLGEEEDAVRWVGIPIEDDEVLLSVYRLPLTTLSGPGQALEIRDEHHEALLDWMKYRAYGKADAETVNLEKSAEHESAFRRYCEEAKSQWERYQHKPRTVAYGGL